MLSTDATSAPSIGPPDPFLTALPSIRYAALHFMATQASTNHTSLDDEAAASTPSSSSGAPPEQSPPEEKPFILRPAVRGTIYFFLVLFLAGMIAWGLIPRILDPDFQDHIKRGEVMVGMSREQVMKAWGAPYQTNVTHTNEGVRREEWVYEDWKSTAEVQHRYLYFEEGVLVGGWYYD